MFSFKNKGQLAFFFFLLFKVKVIRVVHDKILITRVIRQIPVWEKIVVKSHI